jgi:guanylate kinase
MEGRLIIISAPSGAGKTTIVKDLLNRGLNLEFSVSATTRVIRENETDGKDYYFLSVKEFKERIENDEFVEWQEVYRDHFYGTLKKEIDRIWSNGNNALFDVDVRGGINLKKIFGEKSLSIFIMPPSLDILEKRLIARGTDKPEKIRMRVEKAAEEILLSNQFDHTVVNEVLENAINDTVKLIKAFYGENIKSL